METYQDKTMNKRDDFRNNEEADSMNEVLRGEKSAVEVYEQALSKLDSDPEANRLREILKDHKQAVTYWSNEVKLEGSEPDESSGVWGVAAETLVGAAKLIGNSSTLKALKEGEEHGLKEYEGFMESEDASIKHKSFVKDTLITNQRKHINSLNALIKIQ